MVLELEGVYQRLQRLVETDFADDDGVHIGSRFAHAPDGADELLDALTDAHPGDDADHGALGQQAETGLEVSVRQRAEAVGIDPAGNDDHLVARTAFVGVYEVTYGLGVDHDAVGGPVADLCAHQFESAALVTSALTAHHHRHARQASTHRAHQVGA